MLPSWGILSLLKALDPCCLADQVSHDIWSALLCQLLSDEYQTGFLTPCFVTTMLDTGALQHMCCVFMELLECKTSAIMVVINHLKTLFMPRRS
jgi:hypothetical protein